MKKPIEQHERNNMPEELYDMEEIETAFFNYNTDGCEVSESTRQKQKDGWEKFKHFLENYKATSPERCGGC